MNRNRELLNVACVQMAPVWLNKKKTKEKVKLYITEASKKGAELVVFGEAILPGYPFWLSFTNGSSFNDPRQKEIYAHYNRNAINIEGGELEDIGLLCKELQVSCYLGTIEKTRLRGQSLYCTLVYINSDGKILSAHRKLMPTYEERLVWAIGDGNGLKVHSIKDFRIGGLNCWENWMPLARTALYGLGETIHVAVWPGADRNTIDITPFIAKESRSFSIGVSGLMRKSDIPSDIPNFQYILENAPEIMANGGSCIASPDGQWLIEPQVGEEGIYLAELNLQKVLEERQNFDPCGHYSRPDVLKLNIDKERQSIFIENI